IRAEWTPINKSDSSTAGSSLTELRLLHASGDKLETTIKYIIEGAGKRPDFLAVAYDDRWQLLTNERSLNAKASIIQSTGQHVIQIPIPAPSMDRQELLVRWQLADPIALGNLRLPVIELASTQPTRRWLAMADNPVLDFEIPAESGTENTVS